MTPEETKKVIGAISKELEFLQRVKTRLEIENNELKRRVRELESKLDQEATSAKIHS